MTLRELFFFLDKMAYEFEPCSLSLHRHFYEELNGNYVQLSVICTQSSNVLFPEKTAGKDASQMSYVQRTYFKFGGQQIAETYEKNSILKCTI